MDDTGPSTYVPFFRRFTNERAKELAETRDLYEWVRRHPIDRDAVKLSIGKTVLPLIRHLPDDLSDTFLHILYDILSHEEYLHDIPAPDFERMNLQEFVEYRNRLHARQYFIKNQTDIVGSIDSVMGLLFERLATDLPEMASPSPFTIPLIFCLNDPKLLIGNIIGSFNSEVLQTRGIFKRIGGRLYTNICAVNGKVDDRKPYAVPTESKLPLDEIAATYFAGTPLLELFHARVPLKLSNEDRFSHWHILAGSGAGKTTLLENLIRHDLAQPDPPSIVVIEPHSDLVRKLARSDLGVDPIIIDARYPVAINPFAINQERIAKYDALTREQVTASAIQTLSTLLSDIFNVPLTGKQATFFRFMIRFLISFPETMGRNATILDMMKLMTDMEPYREAIGGLPDIQREFFLVDFKSKTYSDTREQVRYRLQALIENPVFARLFTSPETKIDFFAEMNRGAVILIDTAKDHLKEGSAVFGKLMVSLLSHAILERAAIPEKDRKAAFLMIDEAGSYFTSDINDLLSEARKYKTGLILSHQLSDHASPALRASLASNTAIKFCAGVSASDASHMARDMRCTSDFIMNQPRYTFAAHIRNVTPQAVSIPVNPISDMPQLTDEAFEALMAKNRDYVSMSDIPRTNPAQRDNEDPLRTRHSPQDPDENISPEW